MVNELICFFFCADIANIKDMVGDKRFARMCLTCVRLELKLNGCSCPHEDVVKLTF